MPNGHPTPLAQAQDLYNKEWCDERHKLIGQRLDGIELQIRGLVWKVAVLVGAGAGGSVVLQQLIGG